MGLHFLLPIRKVVSAPYSYTGIILIVLGSVLTVWADVLFKRVNTPVKPHDIPTSLVTAGPFRISRNPMYLGMTMVLLGAAILLGSIGAIIPPILFVVLMQTLYIPLEESNLKKTFGPEYLDYGKNVRRWL